MNEESVGISLDLVSRMDDFIMDSLKPKKQSGRKMLELYHGLPLNLFS